VTERDLPERPLDRAGAPTRRGYPRLCRPAGWRRLSLGRAVQGRRALELLSIGAQAGSSGEESETVRALRQGAGDSISQTGQQIVSRQLDIAPTLTIRPGFPVRVIVTRDLVLEPYGG
jgi:hypothetical protein